MARPDTGGIALACSGVTENWERGWVLGASRWGSSVIAALLLGLAKAAATTPPGELSVPELIKAAVPACHLASHLAFANVVLPLVKGMDRRRLRDGRRDMCQGVKEWGGDWGWGKGG